ncbi:hypothetical protein BaRGS_00014063, partial [Batillaria attramentaria]
MIHDYRCSTPLAQDAKLHCDCTLIYCQYTVPTSTCQSSPGPVYRPMVTQRCNRQQARNDDTWIVVSQKRFIHDRQHNPRQKIPRNKSDLKPRLSQCRSQSHDGVTTSLCLTSNCLSQCRFQSVSRVTTSLSAALSQSHDTAPSDLTYRHALRRNSHADDESTKATLAQTLEPRLMPFISQAGHGHRPTARAPTTAAASQARTNVRFLKRRLLQLARWRDVELLYAE